VPQLQRRREAHTFRRMKLLKWSAGLALIGGFLCAPVPVARADKLPEPSPTTTATTNDPKIPFEKYTLPNGLEVILVKDPAVPIVAVDVWYHVGSGLEVVGKSGFAHLFEHMLFQGSKNVGEDKHFDILKKLGATDVNGTTNTDRTNYYEVIPSNQLETALWLESDRMSHLLELLTPESLKNQIDVVRNERRMRYENVPYGQANFRLMQALFPVGHPYRNTTIGLIEDLEHASVDDVKNFYRTWYVPSNATLAIVGDIDIDATKALVNKWFGTFPASKKPVVVPVPPPVVAPQTIAIDDSFAKLRQLKLAWISPAQYAPGDAELDIAAYSLGAEGTGRLYKALIYDQPIATQVRVEQDGAQFSGTFEISVTLRSGADEEQAKKIVLEELAKVRSQPLTDREIARVVAANESRSIYGLESVLGRANRLQEYNQYLGDPDKITWDLDRYRRATPAHIEQIAAQYLTPEHMVTVMANPVPAMHPQVDPASHLHEHHGHDAGTHGGQP
jgi:predicted Zn-dependent peptidase